MSNKSIFQVAVLTLILAVFCYRIYQNHSDEELLLNSKTRIAKIISISKGQVRNPPRGYFMFYLNHKKIKFSEQGDFSFMEVGDSVLIKYAIADPSVATVVDKYVMQKYK
ncbi:MAG: hypothetical protein ACK5B9_00645, partial [Flavobacteriia bacterium]